MTRQHGPALRSLLLEPYDDDYDDDDDAPGQNDMFTFSADTLQRIAERCPHLEEVVVDMERTRGDHREMAMYRALSRLPQLKRVLLRLSCKIASDRDDEPLSVESLKQSFTNCAIDATLARAIFGVISREGRGALQYLRVEPRFVSNSPGIDMTFYMVLRVLIRHWVCRRANTIDQSRVVVREIGRRKTREAVEDCSTETWDDPDCQRLKITLNYSRLCGRGIN